MMMNPYELNWPGLRDVPVVTVDTEAAIIYSQENLLPLKRGKLDRLEFKYVPIEAVLDEFNAEIELEEAFETLESILDIPGVKPLYTDKPTGRKFVHVSSLLALIVLRPEDGPGFETACHSILHFLMNHLEMACLDCGFIRRDCLCQVYDVCLDPKNIECVSYAKESAEKTVQTDPEAPGYAGVLGGQRPGAPTTTVYLPPGTNLSNCERLPDGRLNIKYMKPDGKGEMMAQASGYPGSMPQGVAMLPPGSPYYAGAAMPPGFGPPVGVPVCGPGMHPAMMGPAGYVPMSTSPLTMMSTMLPTTSVPLRHMAPPMFAPGMYQGMRGFYPNSPAATTASGLPEHYAPPRAAMPPPSLPPPAAVKMNSILKKSANPEKGKTMKRSLEKPVEVSEEAKGLGVIKKKRRKSLIVPLKDEKSEEKVENRTRSGRKVVTPKKILEAKGKDVEVNKESKVTKKETKERKSSATDEESDSKKSEKKKSPKIENDEDKVEGAPKEAEMEEKEQEKTEEEKKEGATEEKEKEEGDEKEKAPTVVENGEEDKSDDMDTKEPEAEEPDETVATEADDKEVTPLLEDIKTEENPAEEVPSEAPEDMDTALDSCGDAPKDDSPLKATETAVELSEQRGVELSKGWDVFEYAPTGQKMIRCLCCGQCFDHENYAEKHNEMHTVQRFLRCLECEYTVSASRWYTLLRHLYSKHNTSFVSAENSCKLCGNVFDTLEELEEHVDVHHYNKYKCTYCGTSLLTWDSYKHHVEKCPQAAQGKTYYSCPYCHFAFRDRLMKQVHVKSHQDDAIVCCYCRDGKDWVNWKLLKNHYELLHLPKVKDRNPKKAKACPRCSQGFKSYKGFRNHVAKCSGPKKVTGEEEKKENNTSGAESSSEKNKTEDGSGAEKEPAATKTEQEEEEESNEKENKESGGSNPKEGAETNIKRPRRRKRRLLKQKGPIKCEKCHKKFGAVSTLDRHMAYAHGPESKCDECDHVAKTPMLLKMHKTLKHSEKRHICSECNRTFMYYHQYKVHLAWHARKVAYACPTCDAEFPRQMELRQHQLKDHPAGNNRTVFTCSGCEFKCFSRTTLRAHLRNKHLSSDEEEEGSEASEGEAGQDGADQGGPGSRGSGSELDDDPAARSDSETESDVGEEDLQKLFSWRQSRPAPAGARRSQRTPKPSTKLRDIARTRKVSQRKKQLPAGRRGRRKRSTSPRRPPTPPPPPPAVRRRRPGLKGRPPKRIIKARRNKKEKIEKKIKLRRCGCARFRTYAEFRILKKRMEDKRIVETTIVEDATLPMRRRNSTAESEPEVVRPPKAEVPEVSWTFDTALSSATLSAEERQQLLTVVLDHAYYQKPAPPANEAKACKTPPTPTVEVVAEPNTVVASTPPEPPTSPNPSPTTMRNAAKIAAAAGTRRKRLSSGGPGAAPGQSPAKVRATVNDLESAIKFADNINQLSKLVSILRADKEELPTASGGTVCSFLQTPPRTRLVPAVSSSSAATAGVAHSHTTPNRSSMSDYEIGDIEPLPSDIMASEMESDIDMQGVMSEILEEMRQGDNSGVSPDVSSAAEVLLSLDMSAEERELVADTAQNGILFTPSPPKKPSAVSVEYVNPGGNSQREEMMEVAVTVTETVQDVPSHSTQSEQLVPQSEPEAEPEAEQLTETQVEDQPEERSPDETNKLVVEAAPPSAPKVAVELTNVNIPQNDFLFWAAKHDESEEHQVAAVPAAGEAAVAPSEGGERTTWQLDHQYF